MEFAQTEKIEQMAQQIIERAQHLQQQKNAAADAGQTGDCGNRRQMCLGQDDPLLLYRAKDGIYGAASRPFFPSAAPAHTAAAGTAGRQCRLRAVLAAGDGPAAAGRFLLLPSLRLLGAAADGCSGGAPDLYRLCGRLLQLSSGFVGRI